MQKIKINFKANFENIKCRACGLGQETYEHIIKNHTKKSGVEHIYRDDYDRLVKYTNEVMKFIRRV